MLEDAPSTTRRSDAPVLLIGFNRPYAMRRQITRLREVQPSQLYVAIDGPRPFVPADTPLRDGVIACLDLIDWPCSVHRRLSDSNQGLNGAVVSAINWFFEHVDGGIILEDDCLARPEFFNFASDLLERYANDPRVMHISGLSMIDYPDAPSSYLFATVGHIWGWATWRRAWERIDPSMSGWPAERGQIRASGALGRALSRKFDASLAGRKVRWARWWYLATVTSRGVAIIPSVNLVTNIGVGSDATNTTRRRHPLVLASDSAMTFPLRHPGEVRVDPDYDKRLARYHARSLRDRWGDRIAATRRWIHRIVGRDRHRLDPVPPPGSSSGS